MYEKLKLKFYENGVFVADCDTDISGDIVLPDEVELNGISYAIIGISNWAFMGCSELTGITIPPSVTRIGHNAFTYCSKLERVVIPDSVTDIGECVFFGCASLENIRLPEGVIAIDDHTFEGCARLKEIHIPASVKRVERNAFSRCQQLKTITADEANPDFSTDNGILFNKDRTEIIAYPEGIAEAEYIIPDGVERIGTGAFAYNTSLTKITIPESVSYIGFGAFWSCPALTDIVVSESNPEFTAENGILFNKSRTAIINYPAGRPEKEYIIPEGITVLGCYSFACCEALEKIIIPEGVTSIGNSSFASCWSLTDIIIPDSVAEIGDFTFEDCRMLESIRLPDSLAVIRSGILMFCPRLKNIIIPTGIKWIDEDAFYRSENIEFICYQGDKKQWQALSEDLLLKKTVNVQFAD